MSLALAITVILSVEYTQHLYATDRESQRNQQLKERVSLVRAGMEAELNSVLYLATSLPTYITVNPMRNPEQWSRLSQELTRKAKHIRNLALAPHNVVSFVYPLEGNEKVLGLDYRTKPEQWHTVEMARISEDMVLAGPLTLVQGETALIARIPIFTDPPENASYWGTCSIVINMSSLFETAGLFELARTSDIAMVGVNGLGEQGRVFFGSPALLDDAAVKENVRLPSGHWTIVAQQHNVESNLLMDNLVRIVGYPMLAFAIFSVYSLFLLYRKSLQASMHDELTHLPNRRNFMWHLNQAFESGRHSQSVFTVINVDLDQFKQVNDKFGHGAGDQVLMAAAKRLQSCFRESDVVARTGGDEFLVLLRGIEDVKHIENQIERLHYKLSSEPVHFRNIDIPVTASIGYASYPKDAKSIDELLHQADEAMYQQKSVQASTLNS